MLIVSGRFKCLSKGGANGVLIEIMLILILKVYAKGALEIQQSFLDTSLA